MPIISAVHSNSTLALCCAASEPYAHQYEIQAQELRYAMIKHLWSDRIAQTAEALASHEAWKGGECAYAQATIQPTDGRWVRYAGSPIGTTDMALWIGGLRERPEHVSDGGFDLTMTTLDDVLLD